MYSYVRPFQSNAINQNAYRTSVQDTHSISETALELVFSEDVEVQWLVAEENS